MNPIGGMFLETENQSAKDRKFILSPKLYRLALTSLGLGAILFLIACGAGIL